MSKESGINRVRKCPFCFTPFTREAWAVKHTQTCLKWPDDMPRPKISDKGDRIVISNPQHIHVLPGGWSYVTPERDRKKAIEEFIAAKKPRRPGVVEHPSIRSVEINKQEETTVTEHGKFTVRNDGKEWVVEYEDGRPEERFGSVPGMLYRLQKLLGTDAAAMAVQIGITKGSPA